MNPIKLIINTKTEKYPILIGRKLVSKISTIMNNNSVKFEKCLFVVDKNVPKKLIFQIKKSLKKKKTYLYIFSANEKSKNQNTINSIHKILLDKNFSREDCVLAIGGELLATSVDLLQVHLKEDFNLSIFLQPFYHKWIHLLVVKLE